MKKSTILKILLLIIFLALFMSRFIHLLADFPAGIDSSGDLFTDEGWYSNGAVRNLISGQWVIEGDFNPVVSLPIFQLTSFLGFKLLGLSLLSVRLVSLTYFSFLVLTVFFLIKSENGLDSALLSVLFICTEYYIFLFSRLAFLEIPMLAFVFLTLYLLNKSRSQIFMVFISGVIFLLGILTKTTAFFALPVVVYTIWVGESILKIRLKKIAFFMIIIFIAYSVYFFLANNRFHDDIAYFTYVNFTQRMSFQPLKVFTHLVSFITSTKITHLLIFWLSIVSFSLLAILNHRWYKDRWIVSIIILILSYTAIMSVTSYQPLRYYVPFLILLCIFCGLCCSKILSILKTSAFQGLVISGVLIVFLINTVDIVQYLSAPKYTFITMLREVGEKISQNSSGESIVIGNFANTLSLETGISSLNSSYGVWSFEQRVLKYGPNFFLSTGKDTLPSEVLTEFDLEKIGEYSTLGNYYTGTDIILYKLSKKDNVTN